MNLMGTYLPEFDPFFCIAHIRNTADQQQLIVVKKVFPLRPILKKLTKNSEDSKFIVLFYCI